MADGGAALEHIADQLGHVDTRTAHAHYVHALPPTVDHAVEHLGRLLG